MGENSVVRAVTGQENAQEAPCRRIFFCSSALWRKIRGSEQRASPLELPRGKRDSDIAMHEEAFKMEKKLNALGSISGTAGGGAPSWSLHFHRWHAGSPLPANAS